MNSIFIILILFVLFAFYGLLNYYLGLCGWQYLAQFLPFFGRVWYWLSFWLVSFSYFTARLCGKFFPEPLRYGLTMIGAYWLGAMFYLLQIFVLLDSIRLADKRFRFIPQSFKNNPRFTLTVGLFVALLTIVLLVYGTFNARNPRLVRYEITLDKEAGPLEALHAVMVSDVHLGEIIHKGRLMKMIEMVEDINPDILLLPGDVIDEDIGPFIKQEMAAAFNRLALKYGIYAVPGNHEHIGGHWEQIEKSMAWAGIKVLRDNYTEIDGSFYIIGRDDSSHRRAGENRAERRLDAILEGVDRNKPLILLKHQPTGIEEAIACGIDVQLSGHTHRGQFFPNNLITRRLFVLDWGYMQKDGFNLIVSSGYGTWGPPIRIGNRPELVELVIKFKLSS